MEYTSLHTIQYYDVLAPMVEGIGYYLVDLKIVPLKTQKKVTAVIARKDAQAAGGIGISDCSKVHHLIEPKLENLLGTDDIYMEVTSPGMERNIKNAAEFALFKGQMARVWDKDVSDWISGTIVDSSETSVTLEAESEQKTISYEGIAKAKLLNS